MHLFCEKKKLEDINDRIKMFHRYEDATHTRILSTNIKALSCEAFQLSSIEMKAKGKWICKTNYKTRVMNYVSKHHKVILKHSFLAI